MLHYGHDPSVRYSYSTVPFCTAKWRFAVPFALEVPFVRENTLFPYKFFIQSAANVRKDIRLLKN